MKVQLSAGNDWQSWISRIHDQYAHLRTIRPKNPPADSSMQPIGKDQLSQLIEFAFWASLKSDEGRTTRVCITTADPADLPGGATQLADQDACNEDEIAKLAPTVPQSGCIIVSSLTSGCHIWGFGHGRPRSDVNAVTMYALGPGIVRIDVGPYRPYAVLKRRDLHIVEGIPDGLAHYFGDILKNATPARDPILEANIGFCESLALESLARLIVAQAHGGMVLIVPAETGEWEKSLNFLYKFKVPDIRMYDAVRQGPDPWTIVPETLVRETAALAEIDGAIVMTRDLRVLGFGAKIIADDEPPKVYEARLLGGQQFVKTELKNLGTTRHQSAARSAYAQEDAVALVISQDRRLSVVHRCAPDSVLAVRDVELRL